MKLSRPFKEKADFEYFRKAATGQNKGGPVPLVELFADPGDHGQGFGARGHIKVQLKQREIRHA
jgi:hypothetical protein